MTEYQGVVYCWKRLGNWRSVAVVFKDGKPWGELPGHMSVYDRDEEIIACVRDHVVSSGESLPFVVLSPAVFEVNPAIVRGV